MASLGKLTVNAGEHDRWMAPLTFLAPEAWLNTPSLALVEEKTGRRSPVQLERTTPKGATLTFLATRLKAGQTRHFRVAAAPSIRPKVCITNNTDAHRVSVSILGQKFTSYVYGQEWVRPYLYPVIGPGGAAITRQWPMKSVRGEHQDHPHHKSIWIAHGDCDGVDNWSEEPNHGWQRHQCFHALESGPVFGRIRALNHWCYPDGRKQFEEIREMRFYALPGGVRLFDVDITFRMTQRAVTFKDTKEGGLVSVRVASSMDVRNGGRIENAYGGINEAETWGKPASWCDYSGRVAGKPVGIAIFDHPANPRYPTGWHVRDYGLMTANCFARRQYAPDAKRCGDMVFKKGQETTWRYRLSIHKGNARQGKVSNRFLDYVAPPSVELG